jgi:bla regulator protein BlaR1
LEYTTVSKGRARHAAPLTKGRIVGRVFAGIGIGLGACIVLIVAAFLIMFYSPWFHEQRDQYILMTYRTSNPWLCTWFFSQETIDEVFERNSIVEPEGDTDTDLVTPEPDPEPDTPPKTFAPISEKYGGKIVFDDGSVQIVEFSGTTPKGKYTARLIQVLDASRVFLGQTNNLGDVETGKAGRGQTIVSMCEDNDALCGINAGGFLDNGGVGSGGIPLGTVVKDGEVKVYADDVVNGKTLEHTIIGFNEDDVLIMGSFTEEEIKEQRIRDGMSWRTPAVLVLNGEMAEFTGLAGGYDPRSAIGQRADGTVLLLVVDGSYKRSVDGANYALLADIMNEYGAVNAANLDGGTSSVMALQGKVINTNCNPAIVSRGRYLATSWLVKNVNETASSDTVASESTTAGSTVSSAATDTQE